MKELPTWNDDPANANRPFDAQRDEFASGDDAGILTLESLAHAQERNAEILAEIVGDETSDEANYVVYLENGDGVYQMAKPALKDAELAPVDTGYVNAARTYTPTGGTIETAAPKSLVGAPANKSPVGSTPSMTEHLVGGADGLDAAARPPLFYDERKHAIARWAVVASLFVLALLAAIFGRQFLFAP